MPTLDEIADRACAAAGADFAFVLTRKGRLVTKSAPKDMPEDGRAALVELAERTLGQRRSFAHGELARQMLVPFGGAAPVDVYVAPRDEAILCIVLATYARKDGVAGAMAAAIAELDELLEAEAKKRDRRRGRKFAPGSQKGASTAPPRSKSTGRGKKSTAPPPALDFEDMAAGRGSVPFLAPPRDKPKTMPPSPPPDIAVDPNPAEVGRGTLAAIDVDAEAPEIVYGVAAIGRATMAEIEMSSLPPGDPRSSIPTIRVGLESLPKIRPADLGQMRQTLPFTESAADAKREFEVQQKILGGQTAVAAASSKRTVIVGGSAPRQSSADLSVAKRRSKPVIEAPEVEVAIDVDDDHDESPTVETAAADVPTTPGFSLDVQTSPGVSFELVEDEEAALEEVKGESQRSPRPKTMRPKSPRESGSGIDDWHKALAELVVPRPKKGATAFGLSPKKKPVKK